MDIDDTSSRKCSRFEPVYAWREPRCCQDAIYLVVFSFSSGTCHVVLRNLAKVLFAFCYILLSVRRCWSVGLYNLYDCGVLCFAATLTEIILLLIQMQHNYHTSFECYANAWLS